MGSIPAARCGWGAAGWFCAGTSAVGARAVASGRLRLATLAARWRRTAWTRWAGSDDAKALLAVRSAAVSGGRRVKEAGLGDPRPSSCP